MIKLENEDLKAAKETMLPQFNDGDVVTFTIVEVLEKTDKTNKVYQQVKTKIMDGANAGRDYNFFLRTDNPARTRDTYSLLSTFFSDDQLRTGIVESTMISKTFKATAKHSDYKGKTYTNWRDYTSMANGISAGVPNLNTETEADIPF